MFRNLKIVFFLLISGISSIIYAQSGTIAGVIIDADNSETLIGATVNVENAAGFITGTDIDGRYNISGLNPGTYTLKITYVSYETKLVEGVTVENNEVTVVDIVLNTEFRSALGDSLQLIIKGRPGQETIQSVLTIQKNNMGPSEVLSRDVISRSPGKTTGDALKMMSATSIVDQKFVVIRGLSDRYNLALVNGNLLPSTEPDRKTFAFDLFPSAMLDNLIVYKSAQPNLPGDFAGGIISMNTRDIPDQNFFSVSAGAGYNTVSTFKEYYTYTGGKTDWLGIDDGIRQLPSAFPSTRDEFIDIPLEEKANLGKDFSPWGAYSNPSAPVDQSYQLSGGIIQKFKGAGEFGLIGALTYNNSYVTNISERKDFDNEITPLYEYEDNQYKNNILWGGLLNLSFKANDNNKFTLKNSYSVNSTDITTMRSGINYSKAAYVQNEYYYFSSNQLFSTILGGDHYLPGSKLKAKWGLGVNTLVRDQPNYRTVNYLKNITPAFEGDTSFQTSPSPFASPDNMGIFYSYMDEQTYSANIDFTYPFLIGETKQNFGFGGGYMLKDRVFDARTMGVATSNEIFFNPNYFAIVAMTPAEQFASENFSDSLYYIDETTNASDSYTAQQTNKSVYAMFDNKVGKDLRIVWGVRTEFFVQTLSSFEYTANPNPEPIEVNSAETDSVGLRFDLLPSINITYALNEKSNLRLSGYKTVARPELRELAPFGFYDIETNSSIIGNPSLLATDIYNGDIKVEHFFGAGQIISAGVFYKRFINPIGQRFFFGTARELKPVNDSVATVYGAEFELRKNLGFINRSAKVLEQFTFSTNLSLIRSNTLLHIADTALAGTAERQLQGQSDYVMNFGITYINPQTGLSITTLFNQIGRRISEYGNAQYDNIYENPRPLFDAQVSIPFLKEKGSVKINVSDLLNKNAIFYQDLDENGKYDETLDNTIRSIDGGAKVSLSINYKF